MMQERLAYILDAAIQEFISTGNPVSSKELFQNYDFGIRQARIRSGLQELTEEGYLDQLHHSSGRVPSDKGYECYIERVLVEAESDHAPVSHVSRIAELLDRGMWGDAAEHLSSALGILGVVEDCAESMVYKEGLDHLVEHLDWGHPDAIKGAIRDFEAIDDRIEKVRDIVRGKEFKVFVGKKSPVTKSPELAVVAGSRNDRGREVILLAIGPKRMDYRKVIAMFRNI